MKTLPATTTKDEALSVASEMANAHHRMVEHYRKEYELSAAEAEGRVTSTSEENREYMLNRPPHETTWYDLNELGLGTRAPDAMAKWEGIKERAREELRSGWRAAEASDWLGMSPWERARFLVLREALAEEWLPRGGVEWALIDMLTQAYMGWEANMKLAVGRTLYEAEHVKGQGREKGRFRPIRDWQEAVSAEAEAERFQRMVTRAMRMLQNLRRYAPAININQPRSVNIAAAGGQQVNVTEGDVE